MSTTYSEIVWLRGLLAELGFSQSNSTPLHADNTSAIQIATNPIYHECTKHIEVDCYSIQEALGTCVISLPHVFTDLQIDNVFTKAMTQVSSISCGQIDVFLLTNINLRGDVSQIRHIYLAIISFSSYGMFLYYSTQWAYCPSYPS
jgi:hypothetical protein